MLAKPDKTRHRLDSKLLVYVVVGKHIKSSDDKSYNQVHSYRQHVQTVLLYVILIYHSYVLLYNCHMSTNTKE